MTEQRAVRRYGVRRMDLHAWSDEDCGDLSYADGKPRCEPVYSASDYDALSTELAEAKAEIEGMREALKWVAGHAYAGGKSFGDTPIVRAALIPAKGKGE